MSGITVDLILPDKIILLSRDKMPIKSDVKVLVATNEGAFAQVLCAIAGIKGYTNARSYTNPAEAKESLLKDKPDILIVDLDIPDAAGIELIELAHQQKVSRIIAVGGYKLGALRDKLLSMGITILAKPMKVDDLVKAL